MPKRRHEEDLDYYMRKIRKIERRMKRHHKRRRHDDRHEDSSETMGVCITESDDDDNLTIVERSMSPSGEQVLEDPQPKNNTPDEISPSSIEIVASTATADQTGVTTETVPTTSSEVLLALGDLMPDKPKYGPHMNNDVARIWSTILKSGLQKENKQKIMDFLVPENCPLLRAPKLNPEITSSVTDNIVNRDKKIEAEQNQLGIGLSIISNALSLLINNENVDRLKVISMLSDAGRILSDLHFMQTKSRKNLVFPVLDKKFIDAVKDIDRDEYLYGNNLIEKIKVLKSCQRSGQSIKKPTPATNQSHQGNFNGPPRYNQRTAPRYGPKKSQPFTTTQQRKIHNPHQSTSTIRKPKMMREKPRART